jgi:hypothetical protein
MQQLAPDQRSPDRPFSDCDNNARDLAALEESRAALAALLNDAHGTTYCAEHKRVNQLSSQDGCGNRIVLYHPDALRSATSLGFVGFCGLRRTNLSTHIIAEIEALDDKLLDEMLAYPDVLSYGTLQLCDGDYVNLVVLRTLDAIQSWRGSPVHKYAADVLSPNYYTAIRLHNGFLPGGVTGALSISSTKYYDFQDTPTWRAERKLGPTSS